jgi:NADH:ubiquinone oxidoreductase subunit E
MKGEIEMLPVNLVCHKRFDFEKGDTVFTLFLDAVNGEKAIRICLDLDCHQKNAMALADSFISFANEIRKTF